METAVYVRFLVVNDLFNRLSVWPTWEEAVECADAKIPGARLAEDIAENIPPVLPENRFGTLMRWVEVTPETEQMVATD